MKRNIAVVALTLAVQALLLVPIGWHFGASSGSSSAPIVFGQEVGPAEPPPPPGLLPPPPLPLVQRQESFTGVPFTVDQCENYVSRPSGKGSLIGGRVGADSMIGQDVWISRGARSYKLTTVHPDGTFQGDGPENFVSVGQTLTVSIRPRGAVGAWVVACRVEVGQSAP